MENFCLPLNGKKRKEQNIFSNMFKIQYLMIQAENDNISLTEFSNNSGHFMEDVNTRYGGRRLHTTKN